MSGGFMGVWEVVNMQTIRQQDNNRQIRHNLTTWQQHLSAGRSRRSRFPKELGIFTFAGKELESYSSRIDCQLANKWDYFQDNMKRATSKIIFFQRTTGRRLSKPEVDATFKEFDQNKVKRKVTWNWVCNILDSRWPVKNFRTTNWATKNSAWWWTGKGILMQRKKEGRRSL